MCIWLVIKLLYFTIDIWEAVPATNIIVCNKVHPYSSTGFLY